MILLAQLSDFIGKWANSTYYAYVIRFRYAMFLIIISSFEVLDYTFSATCHSNVMSCFISG